MGRLDDRGGRDAAGKGPYHRPDAELVSLRELGDWKLTDGEPDIRGWEVATVGGRAIGTVRDLLVDRAAGEVVLLDIDLVGGDRRARAPIRAVHIDRSARVIRMDSADIIGGAVGATESSQVDSGGDRTVAHPVTTGDDRTVAHPVTMEGAETRTELLADGTVEETVVERRPVVYEEVVVRRRVIDDGSDDLAPERRPERLED